MSALVMSFFTRHFSLLFFGVLQIFFSAPGQTFLVSLFVNAMFDDLEISKSLFAGIYSAATLSASLLLNPLGRLVDRYPPAWVVVSFSLLMSLGCVLLASASGVMMVFIGFFLLRLIGQGGFVLASSTIMAKQFQKNRGKAIGITTLGYPLSEAIYPSIALLLLVQFGWRSSYMLFALSYLLIMIPAQWTLLKRSGFRENEFLEGELDYHDAYVPKATLTHMCLTEIVTSFHFYVLITALCIPPVLMTGLLFHQESIFAIHDWSMTVVASGLAFYALCKAVGSLVIGPVIDRYGPVWPFSALIFMLGLGTFLAGLGGHSGVIFIYFGLLGTALGFSSPVVNVVLPNLYGTKHLGSIKGYVGMFRNGLTALGPLPVALVMDAGWSVTSLLVWTSLFIFVLAVLPLYLASKLPRMKTGGVPN